MESFKEVNADQLEQTENETVSPPEQEYVPDPIDAISLKLADLLVAGDRSHDSILRVIDESVAEYGVGYAEEIEVLGGFLLHMNTQDFLDTTRTLPNTGERRGREEYKRIMNAVENATEYNYMLTHYIMEQSHDLSHISKLWEVLEIFSGACGKSPRDFEGFKRGILSQVASFHLFEAIGKNPHQSKPKEDAFNAFDMWTENDEAVQIKGRATDELFVEIDTLYWPGIVTGEGASESHYSSKHFADMQKFAMKLKKYEERTGRHVKAYYVVIPETEYDSLTGEPSDAIIERAREAFNKEDAVAEA